MAHATFDTPPRAGIILQMRGDFPLCFRNQHASVPNSRPTTMRNGRSINGFWEDS
jgi:hypothetical protein